MGAAWESGCIAGPGCGAAEKLAQLEGAFELDGDEKPLAAAMILVVEQGQDALIACGGGFEVENGGLEGEAESCADANGFSKSRRQHKFWPES